MTIYDRIKDLRIKSGMTQDDLAHALGYKDRSMITKIEGGKVDISQKKIVAFAKVLNTTPRYLLDGDEKTADPIETLREKIRTNPKYGILFDAAASVSEADIMKVVKMLEAFKEEE